MVNNIEYKLIKHRLVENAKFEIPINAKCEKLIKVIDVVSFIPETHIELIYLIPINQILEIGNKVTTTDDFDGSGYNKPTNQINGIIYSELLVDDNIQFVVKSNKDRHLYVVESKYLIKLE